MIVATRTIFIQVDGRKQPVVIDIYPPEQGDRSWNCSYRIDWPEKPRIAMAHGQDGVQALLIAMQKIGIELYSSSYHLAGNLMLERPGSGYGFPVPRTMRDMLVGDDATDDAP
jgi:uncharacterized protein DUF6968